METYKLKFPRVMLVADSENELKSNPKQRVVIAYKQNTYITWQRATTFEEAENEIGTMPWSYATDLCITDVKAVDHAMSEEECREDYMKNSFKQAGFSDGLSENLLSYFRKGTKSVAEVDPNNYMVSSTTESLKQMFEEAFKAGVEYVNNYDTGREVDSEQWYEANRDNINNAILLTKTQFCDPFPLAQDQLLTDELQFVGCPIDVSDSEYVDFVCKSPEYITNGQTFGRFMGCKNFDDSKVSEFEGMPIDWIDCISIDEDKVIFRVTIKTRIYKQLGMAICRTHPDYDATITCEVVKKLI